MITEMWAYMMTDDDGEEGVAYVETTGGTKVCMVATSKSRAKALHPIAERMATVLDRPWTLVKFTKAEVVEVLEPQ